MKYLGPALLTISMLAFIMASFIANTVFGLIVTGLIAFVAGMIIYCENR